MPKKQAPTNSVSSLNAKVKWKAQDASGNIALRSNFRSGKGPGVSFTIPAEARVLETEHFVYISIKSMATMFEKKGKGLEAIGPDTPIAAQLESEMTDAMKAMKKTTGTKAKSATSMDLPAELEDKLAKAIPAGFKLALKDGKLKLVKARAPRAK